MNVCERCGKRFSHSNLKGIEGKKVSQKDRMYVFWCGRCVQRDERTGVKKQLEKIEQSKDRLVKAIFGLQEKMAEEQVTEVNSGDLLNLLDEEVTKKLNWNQNYYTWEQKMAQPELEKMGYQVLRWYSSDSDSFGPLVRAVDVIKDGVRSVLYYG